MDVEKLLRSTDPTHPSNLIPELLKHFYGLGWVTGTGGGLAIIKDGVAFVAPSGVQKERVASKDLFLLRVPPLYPTEILRAPAGLKMSACAPLFFTSFRLVAGTVCCIHTHSKHAVHATMLNERSKEWSITHQEMIKGIYNAKRKRMRKFGEKLVVPIIENTWREENLQASLEKAILEYPDTCAVLVRRHGLYVWGSSWELAKSMAECYDYLFELGIWMAERGMDPAKIPEGYTATESQ